MYRLSEDKRHRLTILLLIALRRIGERVIITQDDVEWTKGKNIEYVSNGGHMEGSYFGILKPAKHIKHPWQEP